MRELLRESDPVRLSFLVVLLRGEGIAAEVLDAATSGALGGVGAVPGRLVVAAADFPRAMRVLAEAGEAPAA
jgi:hypothetical protein